MGFFKRLFGGPSRADLRLLDSFLTLEQKRVESGAAIEVQRQTLELRKAEMEVEHAEELAKVRREDRESAQKLKQQQREWAATSREKKKAIAAAAKTRGGLQETGDCLVCAGSLNLTPTDISFHYSGHTNREMDLFH